MRKISEYIKEGIQNGRVKNAAELSVVLQVTEATVSRWKSGDRIPDDEQAVRLAELLGKEPGELLAECGAARAKTPETRKAWERIAARMAGATMAGLLAMATLPDPAQAAELEGYRHSEGSNFQKFKGRVKQVVFSHSPCAQPARRPAAAF